MSHQVGFGKETQPESLHQGLESLTYNGEWCWEFGWAIRLSLWWHQSIPLLCRSMDIMPNNAAGPVADMTQGGVWDTGWTRVAPWYSWCFQQGSCSASNPYLDGFPLLYFIEWWRCSMSSMNEIVVPLWCDVDEIQEMWYMPSLPGANTDMEGQWFPVKNLTRVVEESVILVESLLSQLWSLKVSGS